MDGTPRDLLARLCTAAIDAARPAPAIAQHIAALGPPPAGRTVVVGLGKAAASMAAGLEATLDRPLAGLVVTRDGHGFPTQAIDVRYASHPVPDDRGAEAARAILDLVEPLGADDEVVALISGGGSALTTLPCAGVSLDDLQDVNRQLLGCGATIQEMNTVRRHLSAFSGGRLSRAAYPARVTAFVISDVVGDDLATIASGPTVGDATSLADARAILSRYDMPVPASITTALTNAANETPKPGDDALSRTENRLIATPIHSLSAAAAVARSAGVTPIILGDAIEGEAGDVGRVHAGIAASIRLHGEPVAAPAVVLSGGETTVTLPSAGGRGGRNTQFLLGVASALRTHGGDPNIWAAAIDTDGIDGSENNAGAIVTPDTVHRAVSAGLSVDDALTRADAYPLFAALGDLIVTGPTHTNVNDFRAILVL